VATTYQRRLRASTRARPCRAQELDPRSLLRPRGDVRPRRILAAITPPCSRHLQAAEFVYETALFPDLEYSFKHALTHEVTYGGLLRERRRELHARIVEAIETLHRARLAEHAERLAQHALRGELREKAVGYGVR
jgi:hypothetical protein